MLGITAVDNYWTGIYNAESVVLKATSAPPTVWNGSYRTDHPEDLPADIADYLQVTATWAGASESWEPEVKSGSGSYGYGVFYDGYKSFVSIRNKETKAVQVTVAFQDNISSVSGWGFSPGSGVKDGDAISTTAWSGSTTFTVAPSQYYYLKITSATVEIIGCMDSDADNYDKNANSAGNCVYKGCTDETALNYDNRANTDDGSCIALVEGCTCSSADNYNSSANFDDGSCVVDNTTDYELPSSFSTPRFGHVLGGNEDYLVKCGTGLFTEKGVRTEKFLLHANGRFHYLRSNYSGEAARFKITPRQGFTISGTTDDLAWSATNSAPYVGPLMQTEGVDGTEFSIDSVTGTSVTPPPATVSGCTDSTANNYNSSANSDDGSCTYDSTEAGGTTTTANNRVVTYSQTSTVADEPITTNLWWPFFGLAVFTGGAAWFMRK